MLKTILIKIVHLIFGIRRFQNKHIKDIAKNTEYKKILELGSGKKVGNKYPYSMKKFFNNSNKFIMSDVKDYGHKIIDATKMNYKDEFDIILCLNILEHIFDYKKAIKKIYKAIKPEGEVYILVPAFYPLHDEPNDFQRFTIHGLRKLFSDYYIFCIKTLGIKKYPIAYFVICRNKIE